MSTPRTLIVTICLETIFTWGATASAQVTADDFLPPVQGGPAEVKEPAKVKVQGKVVSAATPQDAINAAVEQNAKDLKGGDTPEVGAKMVQFPSGLGFVATGVGTYRTMENPTATRIAKRHAYVLAFTLAKKNLAEILGDLSNEGKESIRLSVSNINLPKEEMSNVSTKSEEAVKQAVARMLRGFVVYEVKDDTKQNMVFVTIVSTPKTLCKVARPAPNAVEVNDLREGLNQVIAEVKNGLVPPVGGRIILMRSTGETAFVGFGSCVVGSSANAAVQARLNLEAQKIASVRAKDSLCGLIIGDKTAWEGSAVESMQDEVKEYAAVQKADPLAKGNEAGVEKLDQARQTFVSKRETTDLYVSARKGVLPPGVNSKTWFDPDHTWAYGMSVYVPSVSNAAAGFAQDMDNAKIVQEINPSGTAGTGATGTTGAGTSSGFTDETNPNIKRPAATTKPGPTGKVGDASEL